MLGLSLVLPWTGCEYIHQKEQLMRSVEANKLLSQAQQLANAIKPELQHQCTGNQLNPSVKSLYLYGLAEKIQLDGYHDDWGIDINSSMLYSNQLLTNQLTDQKLTMIAGQNNSYLYLFFQVSDDHVIYSSLQHSDHPSDHIVLDISKHPLAGPYVLMVSAPGQFQAFSQMQDDLGDIQLSPSTDIQGYWQDTSTGYNVELRLPRPGPDTGLGFNVYDYDHVGDTQFKLMGQYGNQPPDQVSTAVLIKHSPALQSLLEQTQTSASRIYIINPDGWVLARKFNQPPKDITQNQSRLNQTLFDILSQLYMFVSSLKDSPDAGITISTGHLSGQPIDTAKRNITAHSWYKHPGSNQPVMSIVYPVKNFPEVRAVIVIEQNSSAFLSLQNPEFLQTIAYSLLMIMTLSLLMFIYTWKLLRQLLNMRA
ncbi:MAG: hypothetical protein OQL09_08915 [Gammaproteobacteria bacterium]|nr:hypothetical protein [Gammaproteobacteria bacterium]